MGQKSVGRRPSAFRSFESVPFAKDLLRLSILKALDGRHESRLVVTGDSIMSQVGPWR